MLKLNLRKNVKNKASANFLEQNPMRILLFFVAEIEGQSYLSGGYVYEDDGEAVLSFKEC